MDGWTDGVPCSRGGASGDNAASTYSERKAGPFSGRTSGGFEIFVRGGKNVAAVISSFMRDGQVGKVSILLKDFGKLFCLVLEIWKKVSLRSQSQLCELNI